MAGDHLALMPAPEFGKNTRSRTFSLIRPFDMEPDFQYYPATVNTAFALNLGKEQP
jgi:hypothetical protein